MATLAATLGGNASLTKVPLNSLAMIDPTNNRIVADVPVGANAVGLVVANGSVWVINQDDRTLMRIDIHSRKLVKTIALDGAPTGIASGDGSIWILNASASDPTQAEITRVSPSFDDIAERIPTDLGYGDVVEGDLAVGGGSLWVPTPVGDSTYQVVERIDEQTHRVLARIRIFGIRVAQAGATFGEGAFWVVDARGLVPVGPENQRRQSDAGLKRSDRRSTRPGDPPKTRGEKQWGRAVEGFTFRARGVTTGSDQRARNVNRTRETGSCMRG